MEWSILEATGYVRNVSKKRLSIANILSRTSKTSASNLDTRSLAKELQQMIVKGLIESGYKIVSMINLKLNVETTHVLNNDVEQVSSPKQSILTDTPSDIHISIEHVPIALGRLDTSSSIDNNILVGDFKDQIMQLNAEIEALRSSSLSRYLL